MEVVNLQLKIVMQMFPNYSDRIEQLYYSDEDFRTLCLDYFSCMQYIQKFKQEVSEKQNSLDEYKSIRQDLEKELHDFLFTE